MKNSDSSRLSRAVNPMPDHIKDALEGSGLNEAYNARPPYQRNDYVGWIERAKRDETKRKRLGQMLEELKDGTRYMNMKWREHS